MSLNIQKNWNKYVFFGVSDYQGAAATEENIDFVFQYSSASGMFLIE